MKKYIKLFLFLITLGLIMLFFLPNVKGFDDLDFEFQKDTLYTNSNVNNEFYDIFNLRNQTYDLGNYPATYSFTNESVGTNGTNIGFVDTIDANAVVSIINSLDGHNKILHYTCTINSHDFKNIFYVSQVNGIVEFWIRFGENSGLGHVFQLLDDIGVEGNNRLHLAWQSNGEVQYYDNSYHTITTYEADIWYHIKIVFECGAGGLEGLADDTFYIYINSIRYGAYAFNGNPTSFECVQVFSSASANMYFDSIGYSFGKTLEVNDFTDDIVGQEPIGWISDNSVGCTTTIKDTLDGETNVLDLFDASVGVDTKTANISKIFNQSIYQEISFDIATSSLTKRSNIFFLRNSTKVIHLRFLGDQIGYIDGSGYHLIENAIFGSSNNFIPIRIVFDNSLDTFDIYISTILEGNDISYWHNTDIIERFMLSTSTQGVSQYHIYYDNFALNIEPYIIDSNMIPLTIETNYLEVDKYEFALKDVNTFNEIGSSSANSWTDMENGYNHTYLAQDLTPPNNPYVSDPPYPIGSAEDNRVFQVIGNGTTHELTGIQKTNIGIENGIFDVSFCINATQLDNSHGGMKFYIYSYSTWLNTGIWINWTTGNNGAIYAYGAGGTWTLLNNISTSTLTVNDKIDFKVHISSFNYLKVYDNDVLVGSYAFPLVDDTKKGLNLIQFYSQVKIDAGNHNIINIHNVGIYLNGSSICTEEMARVMLDTNDGRWDSKQHYNFFIQGNGNFMLGMSRTVYYVGTPIYQNVTDNFQEYDSTLVHYNTFDRTYVIFSNSTIIFHILGGNFSINSINIEGVKLVQDTNEYPIIFTHGAVNIDDNYFFVDSSNNLRFIHTTNQDDILEFIQAEFVIQNRSSINTALSFRSNIDNNAFGFFRVKFATTSLIIQMENILSTKRVLLESNKTIDSFIILITDTNKNYIDGITEGLITAIKLFDIETSIASVVSLNLIDMIIPLIIILLPTLSISKLYGDFLIIPLFLMFSLILAITGLIPIWLFFVILLSSSLFIFFEKDKKMML